MPGPADFATTYNTAYERVYPGSLAGPGIPSDALNMPEAWASWLRD